MRSRSSFLSSFVWTCLGDSDDDDDDDDDWFEEGGDGGDDEGGGGHEEGIEVSPIVDARKTGFEITFAESNG